MLSILLLANNRGGLEVCRWLRAQGEHLAALVIHPPGHKRRFVKDIISASGLLEQHILDGSLLRKPETLKFLTSLKPDIAVSAFFGFILSRDLLEIPRLGCVNLHPAFLPYNRGLYPNVWPFLDGTPAGATVHFVDEGIDTGEIIARQKVQVDSLDTGKTLHQRCTKLAVELFKRMWPLIRTGEAPRLQQNEENATWHRAQSIKAVEALQLSDVEMALLNRLRALTYPPFPAAYITDTQGDRIYLRLQVLSEEELNAEPPLPEWNWGDIQV